MKITPIVVPGAYKTYEISVPREVVEAQKQERDAVELSSDAKTFAGTIAAVRSQMTERTPEEATRIAEVGKAVESGEYDVPGSDVASYILGVVDLQA